MERGVEPAIFHPPSFLASGRPAHKFRGNGGRSFDRPTATGGSFELRTRRVKREATPCNVSDGHLITFNGRRTVFASSRLY